MIRRWIKRNYYRFNGLKSKVKIAPGVILDTKNRFEGLNVISPGCEVASSSIGLGTYIAANSIIRKASIGRFCSVGSFVQTGLGKHPSATHVSTHPAFFSPFRQAGFTFTDQSLFEEHQFPTPGSGYVVEIGNDVWIGNNVMIMDGVKIGDGAIVAAGAVVTKNVEPYAIVGGVPAQFIRYRFLPEEIARLQQLKWWDWDLEQIKAKSHLFTDIGVFIHNINNDNKK